jgi:hypothetical protein
MADQEHPGGPVAKYTVSNPTRGARFVNTPEGNQVSIPPNGGQVTVELTKAEAKSAERRGDLTVTKATTKEAKKTEGGDGPAGDDGGNQTDNADNAVVKVAHEKFGQYFGFNAAGEKVEGAGPWKKDAAQTWATENKVEFAGSAE